MHSKRLDIQLTPHTGVNLAEQIRQQLIWLITAEQLTPGDTLPAIRRLAEQLGVNLHTVRSAYQKLEEDGLVRTSPGKRAHVLPYDARQLAGIASSQRSHTIGIILPGMSNPFYHEFLRGVDTVERQDQGMIFVCNSNDDPDEGFRYLAKLSARKVDGILAVSQNLGGIACPELGTRPAAAALPMVTVDWPGAEGCSLQIDHESAGWQAGRHLVAHGHRRIGMITFSGQVANVLPVHAGFERALGTGEIPLDQKYIAGVDGFRMEEGALGVRRLLALANPPTAIFCIADTLAFGALQALRAAGLRVPQDIALVSYNNNPYAELVEPPLTTVAVPSYEMGVRAMQMLRQLIAGRMPEERQVLLPTELIIRRSCGCPTAERGGSGSILIEKEGLP